MLKLMLFILCLLILGIAGFYTGVFIIMLYKGCSRQEAVVILQSHFNNSEGYHIEWDTSLFIAIHDSIRKILGDERYARISEKVSITPQFPLVFFFKEGYLPYLCITVDRSSSIEEKKVIENINVDGIFKQYLIYAGYSTLTYCRWSRRTDLRLPCLKVYFATTPEQLEILQKMINTGKKGYLERRWSNERT